MKRTAHSIARTGMARLQDDSHLNAANDPKVLRRVEPSQPLMGPNSTFKYVGKDSTEIRKTFDKARQQQSRIILV